MADTDTSSPILRYNLISQVVEYFNGSDYYPVAAGDGGVSSLNTLNGAITLAAGSGITIIPSGQTLTVAATGGSSVSHSVQVTTNNTPDVNANTFTDTALTHTFALSNAANKVKISVSCNPSSNDPVACIATIKRDSTNLAGGSNGFCSMTNPSGISGVAAFNYCDAPGDTASHTYTIQIRGTNGSSDNFLNRATTDMAVMILEEII